MSVAHSFNPGAQDLISIMKTRRSVSKLILGHNSLGDAGCGELFQFLASDSGKKYKVSEIILGANDIRNEGLEALVNYLTGNRYLRAVYLQNVSLIAFIRNCAYVDIAPIIEQNISQ